MTEDKIVNCLRCEEEFPRLELYNGICKKCQRETILRPVGRMCGSDPNV